jgi:hypothetical protein
MVDAGFLEAVYVSWHDSVTTFERAPLQAPRLNHPRWPLKPHHSNVAIVGARRRRHRVELGSRT